MFFGIHSGQVVDNIQTRVLDGQEYWVAPTVMMAEGVWNGSQGALFYPEQELKKPIQAWNQKPVTISHPADASGNFISAANPGIIEKRTVGFLLNTRYDKKQRTESWINKKKADVVEPRVAQAICDSKVMEVSTGLFFDTDGKPGVWNSKQYVGTAIDHRPDHLALLPDEIGACSIADGAGLLQVNSATKQHPLARLLVNELSHGKIYSLLDSKLRELRGKGMDIYIMDVFADYFVFMQDGKMYRMNYSSGSDAVEVNPTVVEVTETRVFSPVANTDSSQGKEKKMIITPERSAAVTKLIANSAWAESDREFLSNLDDTKFNQLAANSRSLTPPTVNNEPAPAPAAPSAPAPAAPATPLTLEQFLASAPDHLKPQVATLSEGQAVMNALRQKTIQTITANSANKLTPEQLNRFDTGTLQGIADTLAATQNPAPITTAPAANANGLNPYVPVAVAAPQYAGAAPTANSAAGQTGFEPMETIKYDFSKK